MLQAALPALFILPVLGAQYFSTKDNALCLALAIASVILWILAGKAIASRLPSKGAQLTFGLLFFFLLGLYHAARFISYYLQGSYLNAQFFYHLNVSTLTGSWDVFYPLFFIFLGWLACILLIVCLAQRDRVTRPPPAYAIVLLLLGGAVLDQGLLSASREALASFRARHVQDGLSEPDFWEKLHLSENGLKSSVERALPGRNLVLVFLEGLENIYTDPALFPGLTPNLNALDSEGWQLGDLRQVKGSNWTMGGLVSSLCGTPLLHDWSFGGNLIMHSNLLDRAVCLPDILRVAGYRQTFMGGASLEFGGKGAFLSHHGFDRVLGRKALTEHLANTSYLGGWGLFDDSLMDLAFEEFDRLSRLPEPFHLMLLTVDTHHPAGQPSASCPRYADIDNSILHAVHCTDYLVARFVDRLKAHPAYPDTVVVLLSDHLAMRNDAYPLFPENYNRRLYFNVLNSGITGRSGVLATPMDIAPTLLELMSVEHGHEFLAGVDLSSLPDNARSFNPDSAERRAALQHFNGSRLSTRETAKPYIVPIELEEITPVHQMTEIDIIEGGLRFVSTGNDPHFTLPKLENAEGYPIFVAVDMEVPEATWISVYYGTREYPKYSKDRVRWGHAESGRSQLVFPVPAEGDYSPLRIDPGMKPGEYTIHSIEVRFLLHSKEINDSVPTN